MAINLTDFDKIWASSSPLTPYSFSDANYEEGWNFVGSTPPARQMWDSYMKWSDEKQQYIVQNFLPLSGGTMTGTIQRDGNLAVTSADTSYLNIYGGTGYDHGAWFQLTGKSHTEAGGWRIQASDGVNRVNLMGKPDGTLTWKGLRVHNGNATSVWSDFTPSESQAYAVFYDVGFAVVCHQWVGANVSHNANALLFTIDADHLPIQDLRIPFTHSSSAITGVIKIEASTGKVTVESISNTSTAGRITIGGFMWVKAQALW